MGRVFSKIALPSLTIIVFIKAILVSYKKGYFQSKIDNMNVTSIELKYSNVEE